jgi:F420-non-reducing hydrogenase iron-sulfur subunit
MLAMSGPSDFLQHHHFSPLEKEITVEDNQFEPRILAFVCNWCAYGAADLAGVSRIQYPPNLRAVRVMCSATVSPHHILRALQDGADGILVGG